MQCMVTVTPARKLLSGFAGLWINICYRKIPLSWNLVSLIGSQNKYKNNFEYNAKYKICFEYFFVLQETLQPQFQEEKVK